jgi:5'-deoxynucleotidase YfbR-like HD superfamily hydrolase
MTTAIPSAHIPTSTGRMVDIIHPDPAAVDIRDIAHSLARLCRWGGHVLKGERYPYSIFSVAQHSLVVSDRVPSELAMVGLLHDATEAYLGDVIAPLKKLVPSYLALEYEWALAIGERFGLGRQLADIPGEVAEADARSRATERRDLIALGAKFTPVPAAEPYPFRLDMIAPEHAEDAFLARFDRLGGQR